MVKIIYSCSRAKKESKENFTKNKLLNKFYNQIEENKTFVINDTFKVLDDLLTLAEKDTDKACLLPFIRMLDANADSVYNENCYVCPGVMPYRHYCLEPSIQFLVLFYVEFVIADPLILKDGNRVPKIKLQRKDLFDKSELSQVDYSIIYDEYKTWLKKRYNKKSKRKFSPLKYSSYEWHVDYFK